MAYQTNYESQQQCPVCGTTFYETTVMSMTTLAGVYTLCTKCINTPQVTARIKQIEQEYTANPPSFLRSLFLSHIRFVVAAAMRERQYHAINSALADARRHNFISSKKK